MKNIKLWQKVLGFMFLAIALGFVATMPTADVQANLNGHSNTWHCAEGTQCLSRAAQASVPSSGTSMNFWIEARMYRNNSVILRTNQVPNTFTVRTSFRNIPATNLSTYRAGGSSGR